MAKAKKSVKGKGLKVRPKKKAVKARPKTRKKKVVSKARGPEINLEKIGEVTHYFPHVNAAAVKIVKDGLKVGDQIYIKGHTSDFKEKIASMQLDHTTITEAKKGQEIGLLVKSRVRIGDSVYRI